MKDQEVYSDWEGFDSNVHVYDERKEKSYQSRIWWCLGLISIAIFVSIFVREIRDYRVTQTYQYIRAEIRDEEKAVYTVDGVRQWYYLPGHAVKMDGDFVLLYYKDDVRLLEAVATPASWIPHQLFFGALTAFSGWKLWSIYRGKKHTEE